MDSVLTCLVEDRDDFKINFEKSLKKLYKRDFVNSFRDMEQCFKTLISSLPSVEGGEIIVSALAPYYTKEIIEQYGFQPVIVDVEPDTGVFNMELLSKKVSDNTSYIVSSSAYGVMFSINELRELGIPVIEIFLSGLSFDSDMEIMGSLSDFSLISLENEGLLSAMGGAFLTYNSKPGISIKDILEKQPSLGLSELNSSFAISQISDIELLHKKREIIVDFFKDSILKSGYHTLDNSECDQYNLFPVVIKKGLKDVQKYCKNHKITAIRGFQDSIVKNTTNIKCSVANSLSNKTLLFPLFLGMKKESITLISKILSTLP